LDNATTSSVDPASDRSAAQVERVAQFFQTLQPSSIAQMGNYYTADAYFKDPFNEVRGLAAVQKIFSHMYVALDNPHFVVTDRVVQGAQCFLVWDFKFRFKRFDTITEQTVRGTSHLRFNSDGLINYHRDYWDAAEELYEKLPVVRVVMRWLKRRANS
jgi:steroid Delta-isomerase